MQPLEIRFPGTTEPDFDEELDDIPEAEKAKDPLRHARIKRVIDGQVFIGHVEDLEIGKRTRHVLYRIKYDDGDLEHLRREEVLEMKLPEEQVPGFMSEAPQALVIDEISEDEEKVLKRPASRREEPEGGFPSRRGRGPGKRRALEDVELDKEEDAEIDAIMAASEEPSVQFSDRMPARRRRGDPQRAHRSPSFGHRSQGGHAAGEDFASIGAPGRRRARLQGDGRPPPDQPHQWPPGRFHEAEPSRLSEVPRLGDVSRFEATSPGPHGRERVRPRSMAPGPQEPAPRPLRKRPGDLALEPPRFAGKRPLDLGDGGPAPPRPRGPRPRDLAEGLAARPMGKRPLGVAAGMWPPRPGKQPHSLGTTARAPAKPQRTGLPVPSEGADPGATTRIAHAQRPRGLGP